MLDEHMLYWEAWLDLTTCRQSGFSMAAISWQAIDAYARRFGIDHPEEFQTFKEIIFKVDKEYLKWHREQQENK